MSTRARPLLAVCSLLAAGCGATTVRLELAPTLDTGGKPGFESTLSLGVGLPLDYRGRSHHYFQVRGGAGGGLDGATRAGMFVGTVDVDYIYWSEPRLDVRAGLRFSHRRTARDDKIYGFGGRLGLIPIVLHHDASWLVSQLCVGPELRLEHLWSDSNNPRGLFSVPLVVEGNFLGAGD